MIQGATGAASPAWGIRRAPTLVLVSDVGERAPRSLHELSADQQAGLTRALQRLCEAVAEYESSISTALHPSAAAPSRGRDDLAAAQDEIQAAESDLWQLREELLGWERPASAMRAELVADWFSDEDRIYDDLLAGT